MEGPQERGRKTVRPKPLNDPVLDSILASVLAEPEADIHRLAYADRLDEIGRSGLASFIREQLKHPKSAYHGKWDGSIPLHQGISISLPDVEMTRGFISGVKTTIRIWSLHGRRLVRRHPIARLKIKDRYPELMFVDSNSQELQDRPPIYWDTTWCHSSNSPVSQAAKHHLPHALRGYLTGKIHPEKAGGIRWHVYQTSDAAMEDMHRACLLWAKANLP